MTQGRNSRENKPTLNVGLFRRLHWTTPEPGDLNWVDRQGNPTSRRHSDSCRKGIFARTAARAFRVAAVTAVWALVLSLLVVYGLKWVNPSTSSFMLQKRFESGTIASASSKGTRYQWVPIEEISPAMSLAVVASEDQKFALHHGFDFDSIHKALAYNARGNGVRGASTISQQTVKNLFLWPERSLFRKGLEAYFTVLAECFWGKRRILEIYLNIVELGDGIYGAEAASRAYFNKPARQLRTDEAALLAAVLPNPTGYSVKRPSTHVQRRKAWIVKQMHLLAMKRYWKDLR